MEKKISISNTQVILNYNKAYPKDRQELLASKTLKVFLQYFISLQKEKNQDIYRYLTQDGKYDSETATEEFSHFLRLLSVFQLDEIRNDYALDENGLLDTIEEFYKSWRQLQRFAFMSSETRDGFGVNTLVAMDSSLNNLFLRTYRLFEERAMHRRNVVYRQVQAGTNACFSVHHHRNLWDPQYEKLMDIPVIDTVMLRTPMILHPKSSKREGVINEIHENPMNYFAGDSEDWFCFPCRVGKLLCFVYFNSKYIASALSMANLFELATREESEGKPDLICIYGNPDDRNETQFYHDEANDIWIGCISDHPRVEYFGYLKKMCLTLHNLAMMNRGWLPIHGAFVNITLHDGRKKGIMLMGDSGAGKSESIEALKAAGKDLIRDIEVVFDDMGTIHIEDGVPYGQGTEIGAFIRLDDLDPGTPYRDMDRSVIMGPENPNARMVVPASPYRVVVHNHKIDLFAYANNYTNEFGLKQLPIEEVKETCKLGKRMALGTTQEVGISTTYFANPFGPMQKQELCEPLIDKMFQCMKDNGIFVGEIYTHLGFDRSSREGLDVAAKELLDFIMK
ncbi:hypothetical protein QUW03_04935 [Faecalicoccus acidiformans]|uniref:Phosphoenolpyruvate carboxykinase (ATP) n=1 Tax=Faecalicoccus acidiformans TaxID=915173 RepID=A0ABS2FPA9_9FIRM|nr:hypothetical protein [Faecalicoccus acidiformans]MBM6831534.1 hypothetical protein [Faecalicoccus acidiformans]MDM8203715.1 hypothetical protein [Faecalicoccus acidiformans]